MVESSSSATASGQNAAQAIAVARARLARELRAGEGGAPLSVRFSETLAAVVTALVEPALASTAPEWGSVAIVATGGLGRGVLGPHSDIDLVVVTEHRPDDTDERLDAWMRELLHPMWDAGMRTHVTVQDVESWLHAAEDELTLCTALLEVRWLAGGEDLVAGLRARARERFFGAQRATFIQRLAHEVAERHVRYGGTVYRVEPDLKHGPGGLRDMAVVQWCLLATYGSSDLLGLVRDDALRPRMGALLARAQDVLLRLRAGLHLVAQRPQDRLVFQYQDSLPVVLGMLSEGRSVTDEELVAAIETMMQQYYRSARDVLRYGRRACEWCMPPRTARGREQRLDERFYLSDHTLFHYGSDPFRDSPVLALEALSLARDHGVKLSGDTFDCIAEVAGSSISAELQREPEAHDRFFDLLIEPNDALRPSALELSNELGLLERIIPEFGPVRGRMQHDSYHVYTVDQHTLYAIAFLKEIARGDHRKDHPLATALHLEVDESRVLYLATLLHDVGKALEGDQCQTGAKVVSEVAPRLGLSPEEVQRCALLVLEHITMPLLSQKRDLTDPLLIEEFAETVGDRRTLRELYLLSLADMSQVRPGFLTSWKLALLDELYLLTSDFLRRGKTRVRPPRARSGEPVGLPQRYYTLYDVGMRRHHASLIDRLLLQARPVLLELDRAAGGFRLTLVARDRPGLLAQTASVLDEHGLLVVAADVFSVPGRPVVALDIFRVVPKHEGDALPDVSVLSAMEQQLATPLEPRLLQHAPPPLTRPPWGKRQVTTEILFDQDPAGTRSIVEVDTLDQPGVLRRITLAFAAEGLDIALARCLSEGDRVTDVFYVPKLDEQGRRRLQARLQAYLQRG